MTARILRAVVYAGAILSTAMLVLIIGFILVNGIPNLSPTLFEWEYTSDNVSLMPALVDTVLMALLSLVIAAPVGIASAVYLVEYARPASRFVRVVRMTTETLQGIPSIVYGLFGLLFFTTLLGWGLSLLAGAYTLAIMVLLIIMRTTEEALLAVPQSYKHGVVKPTKIGFMLSFWIGMILGIWDVVDASSLSFMNIGDGKYANFLGVNLWGAIACWVAYIVPGLISAAQDKAKGIEPDWKGFTKEEIAQREIEAAKLRELGDPDGIEAPSKQDEDIESDMATGA